MTNIIEDIQNMCIQTFHNHKRLMQALLCALATLLPGGCSKADDPEAGGKAITFGAYVSTRASESDIESLKKSGFGVFASISWDNDFQDMPSAGNYMYNREVKWQSTDDGNGGWIYEPLLFWPAGQKLSFFAYAPYSAGDNSSSIVSISDPNHPGSPKIRHTISDDLKKQVDLLYANNINLIDGYVIPLNFKHALSRINLNVSLADIDSNSSMKLNGLTFRLTNLGNEGTLDLLTGKWTDTSGSTEYVFTNIDSSKESFLIIPADEEAEMELIADCTITTTDTKLDAGCFVSQQLTKTPLKMKFEAGNAYNLNIKINTRSVLIEAELTSWPDEDHKWENDHDKTE